MRLQPHVGFFALDLQLYVHVNDLSHSLNWGYPHPAVPEKVLVVLDEAYAEYVAEPDYPNGLELVGDYPNLIVTRTFSKAYGLAAIRLGWCYSGNKLSSILNRVKGPFNTNTLAQNIALIALKDQDFLLDKFHLKLEDDEI